MSQDVNASCHLLKVTLRVTDADAAREAIANLTSHLSILGVSFASPQEAEISPSRITTAYGPNLYVRPVAEEGNRLGYFVAGSRSGAEVEFELNKRYFSLISLLSKGEHYHSWAELHNALAESDSDWSGAATNTVRTAYRRLRGTMAATGWPLLWSEGRYGLDL